MKKRLLLTLALPFLALALHAQKKPLDHSVYDGWQAVANPTISDDGKYAVYAVNPQEGDGKLVATTLKTLATVTVERGYSSNISKDSKYAFALIKAPFALTREAKIKKKKPEDMPKDSLAIISLSDGKVVKIANVKSYKLPEKSAAAYAYLLDPPADTSKKKGVLKKEKEQGNPLIICRTGASANDTIRYVSDYTFSKNGAWLVVSITPNSKDSLATAGVVLYNTANGERKQLSKGKGRYKGFSFDESGLQLAYVAERDSAKADPKIYKLYYHNAANADTARVIVEQVTNGMADDWAVSENGKLTFSKNGQRLFFGTAPIPAAKDTTIYDFEVAKLDIWHYADDYLQPMQLKNLEKDMKRSYAALVNTADLGRMVQLANEDVPSISINEDADDDGNEEYALATSNKAYRIALQWEGQMPNDVYTVSLKTGERKLIVKGLPGGQPSLSPNGSYILWYNSDTRQYYAYEIATATTVCLTDKLGVNVWDEKNDVPDAPGSYGRAAWMEGDKAVLIYDAYDIWQLDPKGKAAPINLTNGEGRAAKLTFRYQKTDPESRFISPKETILLKAFDNTTKKNGFYTKNMAKLKESPVQRVLDAYSYSPPAKAKNANAMLFAKGNFSTTPNLYLTTNMWKSTQQLSNINPQMKDYLWGTAELMKYKTLNGIDAEAILYKPENFDPAKKYPVIIYFYEKYTDDLYRHYPPAPSRSTVNFAFFTSRGYIVLVPDIYYPAAGQPGQDAYNAVVAAAEELCKNPWADRENMGIQGQSWGGYQVAYLVTRTNMFKAAEAGAPVSNMTSAYGGIRWESGMVRQFQYEHQQSRIGKTLWDGFDLYKENSPIFYADKVQTPLLIMSNDNDGAVPWYQGIEYFSALRRLGKQVWLLQYNGEEHNIKERRNAKDLSIRLQQYFDYYLKGDKMPEWMKNGLPATEKGKTWATQLVD